MGKYFKRLVKRLYVKMLLIGRYSFTKEGQELTENDKICKAICYKLIKHHNSRFLIAPRSGKRYIKNEYHQKHHHEKRQSIIRRSR